MHGPDWQEIFEADNGSAPSDHGQPDFGYGDDPDLGTQLWLEDDEISPLAQAPVELQAEQTEIVIGLVYPDSSSAKGNISTVVIDESLGDFICVGSFVTIRSTNGGEFQAIVEGGPFWDPEAISEQTLAITMSRGRWIPEYHVRYTVRLIGEVTVNGLRKRWSRPRPGDKVFLSTADDLQKVLKSGGNLYLGRTVNPSAFEIRLESSDRRIVGGRKIIVGIPGEGKTHTNGNLISELARANDCCVVLFDLDGEYCALNEPADDPEIVEALENFGRRPEPVANSTVFHLTGKDPSNPNHPDLRTFDIKLEQVPQSELVSLLDLGETDAQAERLYEAFALAKRMMDGFGIFPRNAAERTIADSLDEVSFGYPRMRLSILYDAISAFEAKVRKEELASVKSPEFDSAAAMAKIDAMAKMVHNSGNITSWWGLKGRINRLLRSGVFDDPNIDKVDWDALLQPGRVVVIDLADRDYQTVSNMAISQLLVDIWRTQDRRYRKVRQSGGALVPVEVLVEEADLLMPRGRRDKGEQVQSTITDLILRGRRRFFGVTLVTQFPENLPPDIVRASKGIIAHRVMDSDTLSQVRHMIPGASDAVMEALPELAPGTALLSMPQLAMPVLATMKPCPFRLLTPR